MTRSPTDVGSVARWAGEHRVEPGGESAVPVPDEVPEPPGLITEVHQQVPGALGDPWPVRVGRDAEQPDPPGRELDDEEEVQPAQQHGLDVREVAGEDARGLRGQELPPRLSHASRSGVDAGPAQDQPHGGGRQPMAEPDQRAVEATISPAWVVRGQPQHQLSGDRPGRWSGAASRHGPAAADQVRMPAQHRLRRDEQPRPAAAGDEPAQRRLQRPVGPRRPRSGDLPAQHRQLVTKNEDLRVLGGAAAGEQAEPVHRRPDDQVQQSWSHQLTIMPDCSGRRTSRPDRADEVLGTHRHPSRFRMRDSKVWVQQS